MKSLLDWVLDRLRLIDDETQNQFEPVKAEPGEDSFEWHRKREGTRGDAQIFYKVIQRYDDCRIVLDKYQDGMICIFCLDPGFSGNDELSVRRNVYIGWQNLKCEWKCIYNVLKQAGLSG